MCVQSLLVQVDITRYLKGQAHFTASDTAIDPAVGARRAALASSRYRSGWLARRSAVLLAVGRAHLAGFGHDPATFAAQRPAPIAAAVRARRRPLDQADSPQSLRSTGASFAARRAT